MFGQLCRIYDRNDNRRMLNSLIPQAPDRSAVGPDFVGPRVAAIHGFMGHGLMQKHLLRFIREAGYDDTTMYGHLHSYGAIADDLSQAASEGRKVAIVGYSQGGFQAMKVARALEKRHVDVALLVTIAAGGLGRTLPAQWGFEPRQVPANVAKCLNFFSEGDRLGYDNSLQRNLVRAAHSGQHVENIAFAEHERISHIGLVKCYPQVRVHPSVKKQLLSRLLDELASVAT